MWFLLYVPTCNFIAWLLFHSGFYCTFYTGVLWVLALATGERAAGAGACRWKPGAEVASTSWCSPSVKSVHCGETSEDAWCRLLQKAPALMVHARPEEVSNPAALAEGQCWKGRSVLLSEPGTQSWLFPATIRRALHSTRSILRQETSWMSLTTPKRSPPWTHKKCRSSAGAEGKPARWTCSLLTSSQPQE